MKKKCRCIFLFLIIVLFLVCGLVYVYILFVLGLVDSGNKKEIEVEILKGLFISKIGEILEEKGVVKNGIVFSFYIKVKLKSL